MSTVVLDTITGKSTATTITIGSTPVVSASANSMTIRGEGSAQTSIQQGLAKVWAKLDGTLAAGSMPQDTFNVTSLTDSAAGRHVITIANDMNSVHYSYTAMARQDGSDDRAIIVSQEEDSGTAAGSLPFTTQNDGGSYVDTAGIGITIHGDLA